MATKTSKKTATNRAAKPAAANVDDKILALIADVRRQRDEIAQVEKPRWKTNCAFSPSGGRGQDTINIQVCSDVRQLVWMASIVHSGRNAYSEAAVALGVVAPPFEHQGYSADDWLDDINRRIGRLDVQAKKAKLQALEDRLDKIISPEQRRQIELDAITKELEA